MEGQKRNIVQLERVGATVEWRWGLKGENEKEESRDNEEGSKDSLRKSQEERTPSSASCKYNGLVNKFLFSVI